ncbi:LacI family DNA-binding transcriptional regulator [Devosia sediminis]|uniref:LacI family DNA-binding transcriptional regulator n=1 Tax=Devosia sediminis TaxID=2798801 RepID=A0A934IYN7_9HYPH|nr:LacI family DNA-binding transcriptional regulator [Devosia sediminis]MBJ3785515.1 LacI family DNA-binding transcriptional regulator [Devosia sediminis]
MTELKKTPTIQDVARFANVSTATVSRTLSSPDRVSEGTRARVSEAIRVTGYTLNQTARSLRQRTAKTILVALPDIRNPFFSSILDAIEREATNRGYGVLVANLFLAHEPARRLQEYMLSNRADGLLLLDGSLDVATLRTLSTAPYSVPLVVACEEIPNSGFHMVLTDNMQAAERATRHLIDLGHRRVGHLLGPEHNVVTRERLAGFTKALRDADLPLRQDWMFRGNFEMESGFAAAAHFMALAERPTAIFAANDESAIGFLSGLRQHGIECPRDISMVGFDDLGVAPHYSPPLTTMRQPREMLGRMAAETLIDLLDELDHRPGQLRIVLNSDLIVRASTGHPRKEEAPAA